MSYVVLARKWRPRVLDDLTGQDHVARTLRNAIDASRVPHALLFTGARGVGKTSTARILAMALNCRTNGTSPEPCGECVACREIQSGRSVDVLEIDGASNRGINEIRELRESVMFAPQRDPFKVYIIDEVHMLTQEAFNALLKTLEEPPPHVIFVFATTEPQKIPVTILSRCQRFDFRRIPQRAIIERLSFIAREEALTVDEEALALIARQAQGGMRDALSLLDQLISFSSGAIDARTAAQMIGAADKGALFDLSAAVIDSDVSAALHVLDRVREFGTDAAWFASELVTHFRDLAVLAVSEESSHEQLTSLVESERRRALEQVSKTTPHTLHRYFQMAMDEAEDIHRSSFADFRLELAVINLCRAAEVESIDEIVALLRSQSSGARTPQRSEHHGRSENVDDAEAEPGRATGHAGTRSSQPTEPAAPRAESKPAAAPRTESKPAAAPRTESKPATAPRAESKPAARTSAESKPAAAPRAESKPAAAPRSESKPATAPRAESKPVARTSAAPGTAEKAPPGESAAPSIAAGDNTERANCQSGEATNERDEAETNAADQRPSPARQSAERQVVEKWRGNPPVRRALSLEEWRSMNEHASSVSLGLSGLFQSAYLLQGDETSTQVAISSSFIERLDDGIRDQVDALAIELFGVHPGITFVSHDDVDHSVLEQGERIVDIEAKEERARRAQIRQRLQQHPTTQRVLSYWPEASLHVEVHDLPTEEST